MDDEPRLDHSVRALPQVFIWIPMEFRFYGVHPWKHDAEWQALQVEIETQLDTGESAINTSLLSYILKLAFEWISEHIQS